MTIIDAIKRAQASAPVDVEGLARDLGIKIEKKWLDDDLSGALVRMPNKQYRISVNALHPETRQRFTIAHELGHYIYHRPLLGDGVNDTRAYRTTNTEEYFNPAIGPKQETEANRFAASFLMPAELLERFKGMPIAELAKKLIVSEQALSIRLGVPYKKAA